MQKVIPKRTLTGSILFRVTGLEKHKKAHLLADWIEQAFDGTGLRVSTSTQQHKSGCRESKNIFARKKCQRLWRTKGQLLQGVR